MSDEKIMFRMMTTEEIASGRLDVGRLVAAASVEEALSLARPGETPVRLLTPREVTGRRLDHAMQKRVERDEEARRQRQAEAFDRFVAALTGEPLSTRGENQ